MPYRNCGGMIFSMPLASGETYAGHATLRLPRCTGMEGVYAACHPGLFRNEARPRAGVRTKSGRGDDGNLKRDFGISDPPAIGASAAIGASSAAFHLRDGCRVFRRSHNWPSSESKTITSGRERRASSRSRSVSVSPRDGVSR